MYVSDLFEEITHLQVKNKCVLNRKFNLLFKVFYKIDVRAICSHMYVTYMGTVYIYMGMYEAIKRSIFQNHTF